MLISKENKMKNEIISDLEIISNIYGPYYRPSLNTEEALRKAIAGEAKVFIATKGFRKMVNKENENRVNYFIFCYNNNEYCASLAPDVCARLKIDPELIQLLYFYYRGQQIAGTEDKKLINEIIKERKQLITDIFPFPKIHWLREDPYAESDEDKFFSLGVFFKNLDIGKNEFARLEEEAELGEIAWNKYYKKSK